MIYSKTHTHLLRQFLENYPEDVFKNEHIRGRPEATF